MLCLITNVHHDLFFNVDVKLSRIDSSQHSHTEIRDPLEVVLILQGNTIHNWSNFLPSRDFGNVLYTTWVWSSIFGRVFLPAVKTGQRTVVIYWLCVVQLELDLAAWAPAAHTLLNHECVPIFLPHSTKGPLLFTKGHGQRGAPQHPMPHHNGSGSNIATGHLPLCPSHRPFVVPFFRLFPHS